MRHWDLHVVSDAIIHEVRCNSHRTFVGIGIKGFGLQFSSLSEDVEAASLFGYSVSNPNRQAIIQAKEFFRERAIAC